MDFSKSMEAYRKILNQKGRLAMFYHQPFWSRFMGKFGPNAVAHDSVSAFGAVKKGSEPTGMPIEVFEDFSAKGGVTMGVNVYYPLTGQGVSGDVQLLGKEEKLGYSSYDVEINQKRHGVQKYNGKYSKAMLNKPDVYKHLVGRAGEALNDWFSRWINGLPYDAIFRGHAEHMFNSGEGGPGLTQKSHPNFFVAGSGRVTWSATPATYETNVANALNGLTATASDYMSVDLLTKLAYEASQLKIPKVKYKGGEYYLVIISGPQAYQLAVDSVWKEMQKDANVRGGDNPIFTNNLMGEILGSCLIYVDDNCYGAFTGADRYNTDLTVNYGPQYRMAAPYTNSSKQLGILLGKSAVAVGVGDGYDISEEDWDYKAKKTLGGGLLIGADRVDIYDKDGNYGTAGAFKENTSSLVFATYSPRTISWA